MKSVISHIRGEIVIRDEKAQTISLRPDKALLVNHVMDQTQNSAWFDAWQLPQFDHAGKEQSMLSTQYFLEG
ncbi:hypothetical protein HDV00_002752 [Rhizophlyctis rosea]|nr:hypothetical protein HDV00_002752 [Rhizophlyctis rosea]